MKNYRNFFLIMVSVVFVLLAACENSSDMSKATSNNKPSSSDSTQDTNGEPSNEDITNKEENENTTESTSEGAGDTQQKDKENSSKNNKKEAYLKKLNDMEEADKHAEAKTNIADMEEQEEQRYEKWDKALNEIYGVLKEQLRKEQMDQLREDQRQWIKQRDEAAKEASLQYKGGSMESLEYVATQASLTKERAYKLVAHYMK